MTLPVFDSASGNKVGSGTTNSWNHTIGSGSNRILMVAVSSGSSVTGVTYNGIALTELKSIVYNTPYTFSVWYLLNPPSGTYACTITIGASAFIVGASWSASNSAQSNTFDVAASNGSSAGQTSSTNTVTTNSTNQLVFDAINNDYPSTNTPTAGQTDRYQPATSGVAVGDIVATGINMTLSWSFSISAWAEISVAINGIVPTTHANIADGYGGVFT